MAQELISKLTRFVTHNIYVMLSSSFIYFSDPTHKTNNGLKRLAFHQIPSHTVM